MRKLSYLTVSVVGAALIAFGCNQVAPTTPSENEVVMQQADDAVVPMRASSPIGNCCPDDFELVCGWGGSADHNGDNYTCQKETAARTIIIDNNVPGDCVDGPCIPCVPPCIGDGGGGGEF